MADFEKAYQFMKKHEWNAHQTYTNDPDDPGGATNFGITQNTLSQYRFTHPDFPDSVRDLTEDEAKRIYADVYWIWSGIEDDPLASKLFDMGVNMGLSKAVKGLQAVLSMLGHILVQDGRLGPVTLLQANSEHPSNVLSGLCGYQRRHYEAWIAHKPAREKYRDGLMTRANDIPEA